jgi:hypothetical protein
VSTPGPLLPPVFSRLPLPSSLLYLAVHSPSLLYPPSSPLSLILQVLHYGWHPKLSEEEIIVFPPTSIPLA